MSKKLFGTDGVRGIANQYLTPELALAIGQAAGRYLIRSGAEKRVVLGRDTRRSGPMLGAALASGFCSVGVDVRTLAIVPTGCISFVARTGEYGMGAVISASHNPAPDNGIKLIGHDGRKLSDAAELEIESLLEETGRPSRPMGAGVGDLASAPEEIARYAAFLQTIVPDGLAGMRIALDCSNGAAFQIAGPVFEALGAAICLTGDEPDGLNINAECGATKPQTIQRFTRQTGSEIGIAFDGDADRAIFSDVEGRLINGDRTMAMYIAHWHAALQPKIAVGTVMSNGGFETFLKSQEFDLVRTPVGDKYVSQEMVKTGAKVGGEQSGHLIFSERGPTGDGLVTALELLRILKESKRSASDWWEIYASWPQVLINISIDKRDGWAERPEVASGLADAENALLGHGRLVVRASGTQPMLRVMVEADGVELRDQVASRVVSAIERGLGGKIYSRVDLTDALGD